MKRRALFLDRDGVINVDHGYIGTIERFEFTSGLFDFLRAAQDKGYRLIVVTNQSGVARGKYTEADHHKVTAHMVASLQKEGIALDAVETCFEIKTGGLPPYDRESFWRKPEPGMILAAALRHAIDLSRSAMIGDKDSDMQAAQNAGIPVRLFFSPEGKSAKDALTVQTFVQALERI